MNSAVFEHICAWSKKEDEFLYGAVNVQCEILLNSLISCWNVSELNVVISLQA